MRRGVVRGILGGLLLAASVTVDAAEPRVLGRSELLGEAKSNAELRFYLDRNGIPDVAEARPLSDKGPWDANEVVLYYLDARREISFSRALLLGEPTVSVQRLERSLTDEDIAALSALPSLRDGGEVGSPDPIDVAELEEAGLVDPALSGDVVPASGATDLAAAPAAAAIDVAAATGAAGTDGTADAAGSQAATDLPEVEVVASVPGEDVDLKPTDPTARAEAAAIRAEQAASKVEEAAIRTERAAVRAEAVVEKMAAARKR